MKPVAANDHRRKRAPRAMNPSIDVLVKDPRWNAALDVTRLCHDVLEKCCLEMSVDLNPNAEVSFVFCDDAEIETLNLQWRRIEKPTNVLSFPASRVELLAHALLLGDIVISYDTVMREALERSISLEHHTAHMILHGFLHLVGFDHETDEEAQDMEDVEREVLASLNITDPYAPIAESELTGRKQ